MNQNLPSPKLYSDWKVWGAKLLSVLSLPETIRPVQLPCLALVNLPPANQDGLVVFVVDDATGARPVYSQGGQWLRFSDDTVSS